MESNKRVQVLRNVLVLITLIGVVLFSWLLGHILRYSIPALWHVPLHETDPHLEYGADFEFAGIRRMAVFTGLAPIPQVRIELNGELVPLPAECQALTYYTSLPAKCLTADGRFVTVGGVETNVVVLPGGK
jgi:hypothetical protein